MDLYDGEAFMLRTADGVQQIDGARVTAGIFRTLGVAPVLGRDFREDEHLPGHARTVILTHASWQARFGGAPDVLGRTLVLDAVPHTIVGVLPPGSTSRRPVRRSSGSRCRPIRATRSAAATASPASRG